MVEAGMQSYLFWKLVHHLELYYLFLLYFLDGGYKTRIIMPRHKNLPKFTFAQGLPKLKTIDDLGSLIVFCIFCKFFFMFQLNDLIQRLEFLFITSTPLIFTHSWSFNWVFCDIFVLNRSSTRSMPIFIFYFRWSFAWTDIRVMAFLQFLVS